MATAKKKTKTALAKVRPIGNVGLGAFAEQAYKIYGQKSNEDRSIPDAFDGLKPVQRRILQGMRSLHATPNNPHIKCARIYGDVMGRLHPHGDIAIYGAMVTMVHSDQPLIDGVGNFGDPNTGDGPAAGRYTNARMTHYANAVFFSPRYAPVVPLIPNYDDKDTEAYMLPARLPNAVINGTTGIGVGVATSLPSFTPQSVIAVLEAGLQREVTGKDCNKLQFINNNDGRGLKDLIKTGRAATTFIPVVTMEKGDRDKAIIVLSEFPSNIRIENVKTKVLNLPFVVDWEDRTSLEHGSCYAFHVRKDKTSLTAIQAKLQAMFSVRSNFVQYLTDRAITNAGTPVMADARSGVAQMGFHCYNLPGFFNRWIAQRLVFERLAIKHWLAVQRVLITKCHWLITASVNLDKVMKVLKSRSKTLEADMAKALKIDLEGAKYILDQQVRRLSALDGDEQRARLAELNLGLAAMKADLKAPAKAVHADLQRLKVELGLVPAPAAKKKGSKP